MSTLTSSKGRYRATAWALVGVLATAPLSVSLSQSFVGVALLLFVLEAVWRNRGRLQTGRSRASVPAELWIGAGLFGWLLLSTAVLLAQSSDPLVAFRRATRSELGDLPLYLLAWPAFYVARQPEHERLLRGGLMAFALLVVTGGVAAAFSEFRLAKLLMGHPPVASASNRPQHPAGMLAGLSLYRPIGFMNTRLTYAGLLALALPFLGLSAYAARGVQRIALTMSLALALGVLLLNGTRSILLGTLLVTGLIAAGVLSRRWIGRLSRRAPLVVLLLFAGGIGVFITSVATSATIRSRVLRYTDAQRPVLWASSFDLVRRAPLMGVGSGAFPEAQRAWRGQFVAAHPTTLYWVDNAPDGHAHNDLLHLAAVGGVPAALLYLALVWSLTARAARLRFGLEGMHSERSRIAGGLLWGCLILVPAGLFQCYFQDDEVVIVFWLFMAIACGWSPPNAAAEQLK